MLELKNRPYGVLNPKGDSDFLFVCDHGGGAIPRRLEGLGLKRRDLERHIAYDIGALGVATILAERFSAPLVWQKYSRLVVDCNRQLNHKNLIPIESDHTLIPGNESLKIKSRTDRISSIFTPYHGQIAQILDERSTRNLNTIFVSIHSFTPIMDGHQRPWEIGILSGKDKGFSDRVLEYFTNETEYCVGDNQPYRIDSKDFTVPEHAIKRSLPNVLIEIRQDLIGTEKGQELWCRVISEALSTAKS